jgi:UMF1 family MFS transporter
VFSYIGGFADRRFGPKPVIAFAIVVLMLVSLTVINVTPDTVYGMPVAAVTPDLIFIICGVLIGGMGGMLQSSSRSLMVRHTNEDNATEYFGLYGLSGRATAFLAPLLIGIVTTVTQSARLGVSPVFFLFLIGLILLAYVHKNGDFEK